MRQLVLSERQNVVGRCNKYLAQAPVPITLFSSPRSAGGIHDFYSEGDYWWPNPEDPDGPYIRKDGQTKPDNFTAHRRAMRNLNQWVSTLVAAYHWERLSPERKSEEINRNFPVREPILWVK